MRYHEITEKRSIEAIKNAVLKKKRAYFDKKKKILDSHGSEIKEKLKIDTDYMTFDSEGNFIDWIAKYIDPSDTKKYINWIVSKWLNGHIEFIKDFKEFREPLKTYTELVNSKSSDVEHFLQMMDATMHIKRKLKNHK